MIRLNLLGEDPSIDKSLLMMLGGFVASVIVLVGVFSIMLSSVNSKIANFNVQIEEFENQLVDLRKKTRVVENLEKKRDELNSKLSVIAELKQNKLGPVRILDDLNLSLPDKAWIASVKESGEQMQIYGHALDNQTVTLFMKDLEQSDYFKKIELVETKQALNQGAKVKSFTIKADVSYSGKVKEEKVEEDNKQASLKKDKNVG